MVDILEEGQMFSALSDEAKQIVLDYNDKIFKNIYKMENVNCICGETSATTISNQDRYGFIYETVLCERCGLLYSSPRVVEDVILDFYKSGDYRKVYGTVEEEEKNYEGHLMNAKIIFMDLAEAIKGRTTKTVLDFGCGGGWNLEYFKQSGFETFGCDFDPTMIAMAKRKGFNAEVGSFELIKDKKFDIIILNHVVEHFFDFMQNMFYIVNSLNTNGILYVAVPSMVVYGANRLQNVHNYYFRISHLKYFLNSLSLNIINYGYMFNFQDQFCIFERSNEVNMNTLHSEKENFKAFLRSIGMVI